MTLPARIVRRCSSSCPHSGQRGSAQGRRLHGDECPRPNLRCPDGHTLPGCLQTTPYLILKEERKYNFIAFANKFFLGSRENHRITSSQKSDYGLSLSNGSRTNRVRKRQPYFESLNKAGHQLNALQGHTLAILVRFFSKVRCVVLATGVSTRRMEYVRIVAGTVQTAYRVSGLGN